MIKRTTCIALGSLLAFCLLLVPVVVYAHAQILHTEPADGAVLDKAPDRVRLFFSEPIERDFFALEVYTQNRVRVDRHDARIAPDNVTVLEVSLPQLAAGTYTVSWRALSIDGHVVQGTFAFSVGTASTTRPLLNLPTGGPPFWLGATERWLTFLAAFVLVGGFGFLPLILGPALHAADFDAAVPIRRAMRGLLWTAWPAVVLLLVLNLVALLLQSSEVTGAPLAAVLRSRAITRVLVGTRYGTFWSIRLLLLFAMVGLIAVVTAAGRPRQSVHWIGLAVGAALLLTLSASGHASSVQEHTGLAIVADWLHLIAGAVWIGGLVQLVVGLLPSSKSLDATARRALLARGIRRFSWLGTLSVVALILTGTYAGLMHVPTWQALEDSVYGATLSTKLVLICPLLLFGALNLLVIHPRFVRAAKRKAAASGDKPGVRLFRISVASEITFAVLVLAVTGVLTGLPPASSAGQPFAETRRAGDLSVHLAVTPNQAGTNRVEVTLAGASGRPVTDAQVSLVLGNQQMDMGQREVQAQALGDGRYLTTGNFLSMSGGWNAEVSIRRAGASDQRVAFQVVVGEAADTNRAIFSPARILVNALNVRAAAGAVALVLAVLVFLQLLRLRRSRDRRMGLLVGGALLLVGMFVMGTSLAAAYRASLPNPVPATPASLVRGQQIYVANCASCHGLSGRGDGPAGFLLHPPPADLRLHMAAGHTDAQLYEWISQGVSGTGMPAFGQKLSREDIWNIINYIRTFADPSAATQ